MKILLFLLICSSYSFAAFPTNPVLDNFDRANEAPLANGTWTCPFESSGNSLRILSNVAAANGTFSDCYWSFRVFGPKSEAYATMSTKSANGGATFVNVRLKDVGVSPDGYEADIEPLAGTDASTTYRIDNQAYTALGASFSQEWAAGDAIGLEAIGSTITTYRKPVAGSWGSIFTATDTTYAAAGNIAGGINDTTGRMNDFGGGTIKVVKRINNN